MEKILFVSSLLILSISAYSIESREIAGQNTLYKNVSEVIEVNEAIKNDTKNSIQGRIYYGTRATDGQFPYMAQYVAWTRDGGGILCGGTLIKPNFVLTAAHCLPSTISSIEVYFGAIERNSFPVKKNGNAFWKHSNWVNDVHDFMADIALIMLESGVLYTPANLPPKVNITRNYYQAARLTAIGFGADETGNQSQYLKYTFMTVLPDSSCGPAAYMICAKGDGKSSGGGGDSGTGLFILNTVVGVENFGIGGNDGGTRVDAYLDWIGSITDGNRLQ